MVNKAKVLRGVIDDYFKRSGVQITPTQGADNPAMVMSLCGFNARHVADPSVFGKSVALVGRQPPACRRCSDNRPRRRLQKNEQLSRP